MGFFTNSVDVNDELPSAEAVKTALELSVQDAKGEKHTLHSLVDGFKRTVLVFVRHNGCGVCHLYTGALGKNEAMLATTTAEHRALPKSERTQVIIVGHGAYDGIERYKEQSGHPFDMYVDSEKRVYSALGMTKRFLGKPKNAHPDYFGEETIASVTWQSTKQMVASGMDMFKVGDIALLGGDVVLDQDLQCIFIHRMEDTQDHIAVEKLAEYVGAPKAEGQAVQ